MKYSLRSLMITALVAPPLLAGAYFAARAVQGMRLPFELLVSALLLSGVVVVAGILDYWRWPTRPHWAIAVYTVFAFAFILAVLCIP